MKELCDLIQNRVGEAKPPPFFSLLLPGNDSKNKAVEILSADFLKFSPSSHPVSCSTQDEWLCQSLRDW